MNSYRFNSAHGYAFVDRVTDDNTIPVFAEINEWKTGAFAHTYAPHTAGGALVDNGLGYSPKAAGVKGGNFAYPDGRVTWSVSAELADYYVTTQTETWGLLPRNLW